MAKNLHIVTGGSKGLGAGIARFLALNGDQVVSISRSNGNVHPTIREYHVDLAEQPHCGAILERIFSEFSPEDFEQVTLVNNAGQIEPIAQAIKVAESEIFRSLTVNLYAPIALTTEFLKRTRDHKGHRVILNVSSGVARRPKASWSIYSAAKAGLESFSIALQKELADTPRTRVITFDPGIMDTAMQACIRSSNESDFSELKRFITFKTSGELISPEIVGEAIGNVILSKQGQEKQHITVEELLSAGQ